MAPRESSPRSPRARSVAAAVVVAMSAMVAAPRPARACEPETAALPGYGRTPTPVDRLGCNLAGAFGGRNVLFYGAAILSTMELSASGADHEVRVVFEEHLQSRGFADATVAFGWAGLPAIGAGLYGLGLVSRRDELSGAGAAAIQAMSITFATTVLLKVATGRPYPNHGGDPRSPDRLEHPEWAREWSGPRLEDGAWPSGHAAVATSLAASLTAYYSGSRPWVGWLAYPAAGAVSFGMLSGAHHWLSDVVAGTLIGQAIGWSVGADFRRMHDARVDGDPPASVTARVVPLAGTRGVAVVGTF